MFAGGYFGSIYFGQSYTATYAPAPPPAPAPEPAPAGFLQHHRPPRRRSRRRREQEFIAAIGKTGHFLP